MKMQWPMRAFENDTVLQAIVTEIVRRRQIQTVIETGTEYGGTANAMGEMVEEVYTMDLVQKFKPNDLCPNVHFMLGDSRLCLMDAIEMASEPILFFLDAHSSNPSDDCPLPDELKIIAASRLRPVIVIHDCLVPGTDLGYDSYLNGPISYERIQGLIEDIYLDGHRHYYNDNSAKGARRGVLFIEPK